MDNFTASPTFSLFWKPLVTLMESSIDSQHSPPFKFPWWKSETLVLLAYVGPTEKVGRGDGLYSDSQSRMANCLAVCFETKSPNEANWFNFSRLWLSLVSNSDMFKTYNIFLARQPLNDLHSILFEYRTIFEGLT